MTSSIVPRGPSLPPTAPTSIRQFLQPDKNSAAQSYTHTIFNLDTCVTLLLNNKNILSLSQCVHTSERMTDDDVKLQLLNHKTEVTSNSNMRDGATSCVQHTYGPRIQESARRWHWASNTSSVIHHKHTINRSFELDTDTKYGQ